MMRQIMDETGYCVVCGDNPVFRFDPTIITPQVQKAWGILEGFVVAFNRKESMFCCKCGGSLRIRRLAAVLIRTFYEVSGRSFESIVELCSDAEFQKLKIAEINECGALHSYIKAHPNLHFSQYVPSFCRETRNSLLNQEFFTS